MYVRMFGLGRRVCVTEDPLDTIAFVTDLCWRVVFVLRACSWCFANRACRDRDGGLCRTQLTRRVAQRATEVVAVADRRVLYRDTTDFRKSEYLAGFVFFFPQVLCR